MKQVLKLSCGHIVMRTVKPYYEQPAGKWWCPKCSTYKPIKEVLNQYTEDQ